MPLHEGSGLSFPSPGDLPDPGLEPESPPLQADSLLSEQSSENYSMASLFTQNKVQNP